LKEIKHKCIGITDEELPEKFEAKKEE